MARFDSSPRESPANLGSEIVVFASSEELVEELLVVALLIFNPVGSQLFNERPLLGLVQDIDGDRLLERN